MPPGCGKRMSDGFGQGISISNGSTTRGFSNGCIGKGVNHQSGWFLRTEQEVTYYEKDFVRMQVRDEVIEILPDLRGLVHSSSISSLFSEQK